MKIHQYNLQILWKMIEKLYLAKTLEDFLQQIRFSIDKFNNSHSNISKML